jgi:nucleoside-diphosphate-sugar epimerase
MRVFLTGATGYIGSAVLDALLRRNHRVTAVVRDLEQAERLRARGVKAVIGELGAPASYVAAIDDADAVVHTALEGSVRGVDKDREAIATLLGALGRHQNGSPRTFIYTSGIWVLGPTTGPVDESAPLDPAAYSAWRAAHEQMVLDAGVNGIRTVVIRPGIVYGGTRGIVSDLLKDALNGLVRVVGPGKNRWPTVYARDLGELYVRLLQTPDARGIFHANDEGDERVNDIVDAIADHLAQRPDVRHVPMPEARRKLGAYADALALDLRLRSPRAKALGWTPTLSSVSANIPRLLEEYRGSRRR